MSAAQAQQWETTVKTIGWWRFDPETHSLINWLSGQRVLFEGSASDPPFTRMRFSYIDHQVRCPVLVTARVNPDPHGASGISPNGQISHALIWSIDHLASMAAWRQGANADAEAPPYGLWRRVNDCLFDALPCWPKTELTGYMPGRIDAWGGWWNGTWSPDLRVRCGGYGDNEKPPEKGVEPYLEPLDSTPLSWVFVDAQEATPGVTPAGIHKGPSGVAYLPRTPLTGFETAMPHLLRSDRQALMFPYGVDGRFDRDGYYQADAKFFYADEDTFFILDGASSRGFGTFDGTLRRGIWTFELDDLQEAGIRGEPETYRRRGTPDRSGNLVISRKIYDWRGPLLQPLPRLAQRLTAALIDGWLAWGGSPLRLLDDPKRLAWLEGQGAPGPVPPHQESGFELGAKDQVWVKYGYRAGHFFNPFFMARLHQEGQVEPGSPLPWRWPA